MEAWNAIAAEPRSKKQHGKCIQRTKLSLHGSKKIYKRMPSAALGDHILYAGNLQLSEDEETVCIGSLTG